MYEYSEYNEFNRFPNLDGIENKIIDHLLHSESKYAKLFWKILKYNTKNALSRPELTEKEKLELIDGTVENNHPTDSQEIKTRLFLVPFVDDAWTLQASSVYIYVDNVYPIDQTRSDISVTVETVTHAKIGVLYTDADFLANPNDTNPNDYYYNNDDVPAVTYKSRATVLLKCILAELNGLYLDGIGYLQFNTNKTVNGNNTIPSKAELNLFNRRSFFGHSIKFNMTLSGVSSSDNIGF